MSITYREKIVNQLQGEIENYYTKCSRPPRAIKLTPEVKRMFERCAADDSRSTELYQQIYKHGVEKTMPRLFGMRVLTWNAQHVQVL